MTKKKTSSGGKAEAAGSNYETLVAAWYCTRLLLGRTADPLFDLPSDTRLVAIDCQTDEPVDDVNCETADKGKLFVQAKRSVSLSRGDNTPLGKALDQFVRQQQAWAEGRNSGSRTLHGSRDRLILTTRGSSSQKIIEILPRLLRGLRDRSALNLLSEAQKSEGELEVAETIEAHVRRSWQKAYGREASAAEIGCLLRLIWVQKLDVEDGGADRSMALTLMRAAILADPAQADAAFAELIKQCARLRAERSGADPSTLQAMLSRVGIKLDPLPDYRADVESLRRWTNLQLRKAARFTRLLETAPLSTVEREIWPVFREQVPKQSFLVVGDPGAGKSGLMYRVSAELEGSQDVVFIPADVLNVENLAQLRAELGISRHLGEVLKNWPGRGRGVLIVDALDAARKLETQVVLRESLDEVLLLAGGRWNVIASVRRYDLRQGADWRRAFRGAPLDPNHSDAEFSAVRHLAVGRLTDGEIAQTTTFSPPLQQLFLQADTRLKQLLRNIFNLHLLAELIDLGVITSELMAIRTQSELLEMYWRHRVRRDDGKHDAREAVLTTVLTEMISRKALRVFRADVRAGTDAEALVDLERNDILRAEDGAHGANEDILLFSHHILFDYCVARLLFKRGRDPARLVELLRNDRAMTLMVGPSLTMALHDVWDSDVTRVPFWDLAIAIAGETALPEAARLTAPMVAAESTSALADMQPLLDCLRAIGSDLQAVERNMHHLIGALMVRQRAGAMLVGPDAGPWMELASALSEVDTDAAFFAIKPLIAMGTEKPQSLTSQQLAAAGTAARRMLKFGLMRAQRPGFLIIAGIMAVARTAASDVAASSALLRRLIQPEHLARFGHEELRWIAEHAATLAKHDIAFVVDLYAAAYGYEDTASDTRTSIGNSGILPLTSNRRQDYQSAWYQLEKAVPAILQEFPAEGTMAVARAMFGYVGRSQKSRSEEERKPHAFTLGGREARYITDHSHAWYRSGVRHPNDGPALLQKFDAHLASLATVAGGPAQLERILETLTAEAGLAVIWGSLLVAGAAHPSEFGKVLAPLATAEPILRGWDTRYQAGKFIGGVFPILDDAQRRDIERAILGLSDERTKKILAGTIPDGLSATPEMQQFLETLRADSDAPVNRPVFQIMSSTRVFDTDAYLEEKGISTTDPASAKLRDAMRLVEGLPKNIQGPQITPEVARADIAAMLTVCDVLDATLQSSVDALLYQTAEAELAEAAARITQAPPEVLADPDVRAQLKEMLLRTAGSAHPPLDPEHEADFHENLHWGGPSARTSAARGLICLVRFDTTADVAALEAIHRLARDPVCHVRLQIASDLHLLHAFDREWMWSELEYIAAHEPTRGVVHAALHSAANIWGIDPPRFIALCKSVLTRYAGQSGKGIASCLASATSLIADVFIHGDSAEAEAFVANELNKFPDNSEVIGNWIPRHSGNLLLGSTSDPVDPKNSARTRTVSLYREILERSLQIADRLTTEHDIHKSEGWTEADRALLGEMFHIMDEVAIRLYFAAGGNSPDDGTVPSNEKLRFYADVRPLLEKLSGVLAVHVAHYLIQTLEALIPIDPGGIFDLIARSVRSSEAGGYTTESMAAELIVRIVERYLAEHRDVFADQARLNALMDCLDAFVRAGWPAAQALTFRLGEIWR